MPQDLDRKIMIRFVSKVDFGACTDVDSMMEAYRNAPVIHRTFAVVPTGWMGNVYANVRGEWDRLEGHSSTFYGRQPRAADVSSIICKSGVASLVVVGDVRDVRNVQDVKLTCEELYVVMGNFFMESKRHPSAALNAMCVS
jgi:hypothetical protein